MLYKHSDIRESLISVDMDLFTEFTRGFLSEVAGFLTPKEISLLPLGVQVLTCELTMRFLTDYLNGDVYFKVTKPNHNLIRARAQMRLLEDIEEKLPQMQEKECLMMLWFFQKQKKSTIKCTRIRKVMYHSRKNRVDFCCISRIATSFTSWLVRLISMSISTRIQLPE